MSHKHNKVTKEQRIIIMKLYMEFVYELRRTPSKSINTKALLNIVTEHVVNGTSMSNHNATEHNILYNRLIEVYGSQENFDAIVNLITKSNGQPHEIVIENENMIKDDDVTIKIDI